MSLVGRPQPGQTATKPSHNTPSLIGLENVTQQPNAAIWEQADEEKEKLFAQLELVRARLEKKAGVKRSDIDLRRCNWTQVVQEVEDTSRRWKISSKGSKMAECIDKVGRASKAFESWLDLLPAGDYGSCIAGAFKLIVGAAGQYAKVEIAVFGALSDIPEIMEDARDYINIYANLRDQTLERKTFDLFRAILRSLGHIMKFFAEGSIRKIAMPLIKQSSYQTELLESVAEVRKQATKIQDEANKCLAKRILEQGDIQAATYLNSQQEIHLLQKIHSLLVNSYSLTSKHRGESSASDPVGPPIDTNRRSQRAICYPETKQSTEQHFPPTKPTYVKAAADQLAGQLLDLLHYDPGLAPNDVATCLRLGRGLDEQAKAKAASLVHSSRFRDFISAGDTPDSLLVNGRDDLGAVEGLSPLSLVAAELVHRCQQARTVFTTSFFCDRRRFKMETTPVGSPAVGLMSSLVGQILSQMLQRGIVVNLAFLTKVDWHNVEKLKLVILSIIFRELINQLPAGSVLVCVIDEVSLYETALHEKETDAVVRRLARLSVRNDGLIFKLLVACRGRPVGVGRYFLGKTIDLDEQVETNDSAISQVSKLSIGF